MELSENLQDLELKIFLRRICRLTMPSRRSLDAESRREDRQPRSFPLLLCPWQDGAPVEADSHFVVARDVSNHGMGLLLSEPVWSEQFVIGVQPDKNDPSQPWFFLGDTRHLTDLGGGCWALGIKFTEFANARFVQELQGLTPLMQQLSTRAESDFEPPLPANVDSCEHPLAPVSDLAPRTICRYCTAEVAGEAVKCRHCGEWLQRLEPEPGDVPSTGDETLGDESRARPISGSLLLLVLLLGFVGVLAFGGFLLPT